MAVDKDMPFDVEDRLIFPTVCIVVPDEELKFIGPAALRLIEEELKVIVPDTERISIVLVPVADKVTAPPEILTPDEELSIMVPEAELKLIFP